MPPNGTGNGNRNESHDGDGPAGSWALGVVVVLFVLAAGCLGATPPSGTVTPADGSPTVTPGDRSPTAAPDDESPTAAPDYRTHVLDRYHDRAPVRGGIRNRAGEDLRPRRYVTLLASSADVERVRFGELDAETAAFVNRTNLSRSYLVVVQTFPASSVPDHRVESLRRTGGTVRLSINDSSRGATTDITVETLFVRVDRGDRAPPDRAVVTTEDGRRFDSTAGVVTDAPDDRSPSPSPTPTVTLPYASDDPGENVDDPLGVRVENAGTRTHGYGVVVTATGGADGSTLTLIDRRGKIRPNGTLTIPDVVARTGSYEVTVTAELPAGDGGRRTVRETAVWRIDAEAGPLVIRLTDDAVTVQQSGANASDA